MKDRHSALHERRGDENKRGALDRVVPLGSHRLSSRLWPGIDGETSPIRKTDVGSRDYYSTTKARIACSPSLSPAKHNERTRLCLEGTQTQLIEVRLSSM